jgi:hypothetical protein
MVATALRPQPVLERMMALTDARSFRLLPLVAALVFVVAACDGAASASVAPTATPTAAPTAKPTPRPTPTPTPSPTPKPEAVESVKIGSGYTLVESQAPGGMSGSMSLNLAGKTVEETFSGREVHKGDDLVGTLMVLEIEGVPMSTAAFEGGAKGAASNVAGKLTYTKILGQRVAMVTADQGTFAMFVLDDNIVMVIGATPEDTKPILNSVLKANF